MPKDIAPPNGVVAPLGGIEPPFWPCYGPTLPTKLQRIPFWF